MPCRAIIGLGNPGTRYAMTRHNMGFITLDAIASREAIGFSGSKIAQAETAVLQMDLAGTKTDIRLIKPMTYMNRSGEAVAPFLRYYRIDPQEILVIHDDLDQPLGNMKFAKKGGTGGHNGVRSIIQYLGVNDFPRLKLGIGRPMPTIPVEQYVLMPFEPHELPVCQRVIATAIEAVSLFLTKGIDAAMNQFNKKSVEGA
ncbi:MAG: aminoacyl-tRNA hydrolase [Dissulfuribacterales bacterium]